MSHLTIFPTPLSLPSRLSMSDIIPGLSLAQEMGEEMKEWGHRLYKGSLLDDFTKVISSGS